MIAEAPQLTLAPTLARRIILAAQRTRFRGIGGYSPAAFAAKGDDRPFPQAERESEYFRDFFAMFPKFDLDNVVCDKDILDFGSGYGGRTVDYARISGARSVIGVEPIERHIELSRKYAEAIGVTNVDFRICGQTTIPLDTESVDVVVSYDVLEHVASPPDSVRELYRVMRPGGFAFVVFPVYFGLVSHHLDYITSLPGLHWVFSADSLVSAVNSILAENDFGTSRQPPPARSFDDKRNVLPTLNGLSGWHLPRLFRHFRVVQIERRAILSSRPVLRSITSALTSRFVPIIIRDALTGSVVCVLQKPD